MSMSSKKPTSAYMKDNFVVTLSSILVWIPCLSVYICSAVEFPHASLMAAFAFCRSESSTANTYFIDDDVLVICLTLARVAEGKSTKIEVQQQINERVLSKQVLNRGVYCDRQSIACQTVYRYLLFASSKRSFLPIETNHQLKEGEKVPGWVAAGLPVWKVIMMNVLWKVMNIWPTML